MYLESLISASGKMVLLDKLLPHLRAHGHKVTSLFSLQRRVCRWQWCCCVGVDLLANGESVGSVGRLLSRQTLPVRTLGRRCERRWTSSSNWSLFGTLVCVCVRGCWQYCCDFFSSQLISIDGWCWHRRCVYFHVVDARWWCWYQFDCCWYCYHFRLVN